MDPMGYGLTPSLPNTSRGLVLGWYVLGSKDLQKQGVGKHMVRGQQGVWKLFFKTALFESKGLYLQSTIPGRTIF